MHPVQGNDTAALSHDNSGERPAGGLLGWRAHSSSRSSGGVGVRNPVSRKYMNIKFTLFSTQREAWGPSGDERSGSKGHSTLLIVAVPSPVARVHERATPELPPQQSFQFPITRVLEHVDRAPACLCFGAWQPLAGPAPHSDPAPSTLDTQQMQQAQASGRQQAKPHPRSN